MKHSYFFLVQVLLVIKATAQVLPTTAGNWLPVPLTYHSPHHNVMAIFQQPAALAFLQKSSVACSGAKPYFMPELFAGGVSVSNPLKKGGWAAGLSYMGSNDYRLSSVVVGYAKSLQDQLKLGTAFHLYEQRINGYATSYKIGVDIGTIWTIEKKCFLHVQLSHPFSFKKKELQSDQMAAVYKAGLLYEWSSYFQTGIECIQSDATPIHAQVFMQYAPSDFIFIKSGFNTSQLQYFFGAGFLYQQLRLDVSVMFHHYLGATPFLLIAFFPKSTFKK